MCWEPAGLEGEISQATETETTSNNWQHKQLEAAESSSINNTSSN
jgi:hypothetical protein